MNQRPSTWGGEQRQSRLSAFLGIDVRHNTGVQVGDGNTQIIQAAPRLVTWPARVGFPPVVADRYQDRHTAPEFTAPEVVLTGLGGVGKTQLAARHARKAWGDQELDLAVWINAVTRSAVVAGYAEAAVRAIEGTDQRAARRNPEQVARALLAWLGTTRLRWLIVLDDLRDPTDMRGWWPPRTATGQVLVTTRRRDASLVREGWQLVEVDVFTESESVSYLSAKIPDQAESEHVRGLADDLGHLPLALAQAAAFIADKPLLDLAAYRSRLADRRKTLAQVMPAATEVPDEYRDTVAATWSLSIEHANGLRPEGLARPVLELACLLDPAGIPTKVFTFSAVCGYLRRLLAQDVDADTVADALGCLHRLSLITLDKNDRVRRVRVHALVQRATRDTLAPERLPFLARAAADALLEIWPEIETDTPLAHALRANTDVLYSHASAHLWASGGHPVLFRAVRSLGEAGLLAAAIDYAVRLRDDARQHLAADHPDAMETRQSVAYWRGEAGDAAGAVSELKTLLVDHQRVLGPDHPATLTTRHNLARWRGETGDTAVAVAEFETLLVDRRRVLGPDHPHTLTTRYNLARWRAETGDVAGAVAELSKLLADRRRVLGPDHPHTLATRHNLARWRAESGERNEAVRELEDLLADHLRVLGPNHPETLTNRHNLALWREMAGAPDRAMAELKDVLADRRRVLGPDHPHTLTTRGLIALMLGRAGDAAQAVREFESLLDDQQRILGQHHPHTTTTRGDLAHWKSRLQARDGAAEVDDT
ncbi:hypothetical protein ALI144C_10060 [Actinosynnema sp. ALI-1.44]|uniref:tetratricopeptide repeat protein n=1 Tax=Actinosynnema sp. ALI-1.44 TaxID=1933779 RepID=UPI00097BFEAA|nr:tetratricopeptide repeat protein [Actinosynnema sp. ALI-1.44]ONI86978.1 hypothetical protein ALI144C_10060 [Actinosynnema sp. ALI-1.44]